MRRRILALILILASISVVLSADPCTIDLQELSAGTCIEQTYNMLFGGNAHYACNSYIGETWWYYLPCTATVSSGTILTNTGVIVAEGWSNEHDKVSACAGRDGWLCNTDPYFGFNTNPSIAYVGYCDSSDETCVKCSAQNTEIFSYQGTRLNGISDAGDGLCESGCGAESLCDEISTNTWSNRQIDTTPFEAYCGSNCGISDTSCESDFGADVLCDELDPNSEVCISDYCDSQNRLVDYDGSGTNTNVFCANDCTCDNVVDTLLCDQNCGASSNCHRQDIGYNITNNGCGNTCQWITCGLYAWDTIDCFSSCSSSTQCYSPGVCDLVGADINSCVVDNEQPVVTIINPINDSRFDSNLLSYSFSVTDNADAVLDCYYSLNGVNNSIGTVNQGSTKNGNIVLSSEDWYEIFFYCTDESSNTGYSNIRHFLYDESEASYLNLGIDDLTSTVDNTLITGDLIRIRALWNDNFELNYSELYSNTSGIWSLEQTFYHEGVSSNWTNFEFNTTGYEDETISFFIKTFDSALNERLTNTIDAYINLPKTTISAIIREGSGNYSNRLEFVNDARSVSGIKAVDSISTAFLGDFILTHDGIGTTINNKFRLSFDLPVGVSIKISESNNHNSAVYLGTSFNQSLPSCNGLTPNFGQDSCEVWVWMDTIEAVPPVIDLNNIFIISQSI